MTYFRLLCWIVLLCGICNINAQVDTSALIEEIIITSNSIRSLNVGVMEEKWNSSEIHSKGSENLGNFLNGTANVFIKNYGPGSLSTSTVRGGSASHTLVLWNDLPIQSPVLGLLDLSLISTWSIDKISFQKGGNSSMWGSGAIGGVINLSNQNNASSPVSFQNSTSIGSFGKKQVQLKANVKLKDFRLATSYSALDSKNNFPYVISGDVTDTLSNAAQSQQNFNQDLYWNINDKNELAIHFWKLKANRQIPPRTIQNQNKAYQIDRADRLSMHWSNFQQKNKLKIKLGYFNEDIDFFDPTVELKSLTKFISVFTDVNNEYIFNENHRILLGISNFNTRVISVDNYVNDPSENKIAGLASYLYEKGKFRFKIDARQEFVDRKSIPFIPSFAWSYQMNPLLSFKGKVSRNYRLPTLNDRFWDKVGNPDLLPESGWSQEVSGIFIKELEQKTINFSVTGFNRMIEHWIQWSIVEGNSFWSPYNLNRVWSRGMESRFSYEYYNSMTSVTFAAGHDFVLATNTIAVTVPKVGIGDQLWYTPKHSAFAEIKIKKGQLSGSYRYQLTSSTTGVNGNLDAFSIAKIGIDYAFKFQLMKGSMYLNINNLWDEHYRIVEFRPMPGRNYEIGININFKKT